MNVLRLKTGEKIAVNMKTVNRITELLLTGTELILASPDVMFWRDNFQSITPMAK